jgi:hypothetical protein
LLATTAKTLRPGETWRNGTKVLDLEEKVVSGEIGSFGKG